MRREIAGQYKSEIVTAQLKWEERSRAIWEGRGAENEDEGAEEESKDGEEKAQEDESATGEMSGAAAALAGVVGASGGSGKRRRLVSREPKGCKKGRKSIGDEDDEDTEYKEEDDEDDEDLEGSSLSLEPGWEGVNDERYLLAIGLQAIQQ